ncbi:hypothetical protein PBY51_018515 [Eleginops maclovinus]|uniref:Uncharacterized protein n=1 Tax=Eleginops maclovinus TaxID=56733 RepID=A0AAN8AUY6_ELEMC|nr:hypothetical protein PBY51_018515 [Eleginops maclovinus]
MNSEQDGESVDRCLQSTLSSLYPPYQLTAPTLLPQVLRVVQGRYRGDALHFLLHFLLPAKQLLEELQQHACVQYGGLLLRHPGWPLCLQEKLVVQLSPLDLNLLHPGDFYFLVSPPPSRPHSSSSPLPPRVLLVSTSPCRQHVEQQEVQRLLLAAGGDVFRLPWEDLVFPQFINRRKEEPEDLSQSAACSEAKTGNIIQSAASSDGEESEGDLTSQEPMGGEDSYSENHLVQTLPTGGACLKINTETETEEDEELMENHEMLADDGEGEEEEEGLLNESEETEEELYDMEGMQEVEEEVKGEEEEEEVKVEEEEEVEVEEEVLVTVMLHSQKGKDEERGGEQTHKHKEADSEDSYSEKKAQHTPSEESKTQHPEDSYSENKAQHTHSEESNTQEEPEDRQEVKEEEDEEEEDGGRRAAELQTEDITSPSPTEPAAASVPVQSPKSSQCSFYGELLRSAAVCLPGSRDRSGRALLTVCTLNPVWTLPHCETRGLLQLLLYYTSILRKPPTPPPSDNPPPYTSILRNPPQHVHPQEPPPPLHLHPQVTPVHLHPQVTPPTPPPSGNSSYTSTLRNPPQHVHPQEPPPPTPTPSGNPRTPTPSGNPPPYTYTLRKEVPALGLTVLVDARGAAPAPPLFSALRSLQDKEPGSVHSVLLLVHKDSALQLHTPADTQVLLSLKALQKQVDLQQLPAELGGSFRFTHSSWLCFRLRVEQLRRQCSDVIELLQETIEVLQGTPLPAAAPDAERLLSSFQEVMCGVLRDGRVVQLQQEGGASLSLLREGVREGVRGGEKEEVQEVQALYDQVDELLHRLVTLSNRRTHQLSSVLRLRALEASFAQVQTWLQDIGEPRLKSLSEAEDSLELLRKKREEFKEFHTTAYEWGSLGSSLLAQVERWVEEWSADQGSADQWSADLQQCEVRVQRFWSELQDFSERVRTTGQNLERAKRLYSLLDQAYGWALQGMRHLAGVSMEDCTLPEKCQAVISCLEEYRLQHPPIPDALFQELRAEAGELRGGRGLQQWSFAWSKCQETKEVFDRKLDAALRTRDSAHRKESDSAHAHNSKESDTALTRTSDPAHRRDSDSALIRTSDPTHRRDSALIRTSDPAHKQKSDSAHSRSSAPFRRTLSALWGFQEKTEDSVSSPSLSSSSSSLLASSSPRNSSSSSLLTATSSPLPPPEHPPPSARQHLRKTQSFDCPPTPEAQWSGPVPRSVNDPVRRGNTGVFIRGLEVSSPEASARTLCPRTSALSWAGPQTPQTPRTTSPAAESRPRGSKLRHVVEEMVTTEREYVRSLRYTLHHYLPEMERGDLPQDLRGKRSVVFGNLSRILDFHSQFFLKELEACWKHPLRVPHCFLRHQEQFSLYALYSKNKPKSDALLAAHGNSFFRRKQLELGDKMDLSSYLLKPVQRMSKYALLLSDLIKEVGGAQESELSALQAATNMVKFQLRHGNDLLAMDAIRDCDVNLKEQGQLIRQDEFTVWSGRRKCQRHIFLFEELVLFSKPKKVEGGLDVFIYKHSFKTADVGLTETSGDNGLRFEIWFRRYTRKSQTFVLQAATTEVKLAWTNGIARILWTQANRNKEMRLKEMVSMGVGNKPFLDIQPSDAAISDRAVHYIMKSRGARTRASIAVSTFDHSDPFKRGALTPEHPASGPSSSGLLGPLNLHMYSQPPPPAEGSFITTCIEEDETEHETSSQPSMTTESSGSSSRCLSGSTGSDSGCPPSTLQEETCPSQQLLTSFSPPAKSIGPASIV